MRTLLRRLVRALESNRLWRRFGTRCLVPRLRVLRAPDDPSGRWRDIYGDFARRPHLERTLAGTWLALGPRRAVAGLMLSESEGELVLHTMRVRRPYRGFGIGAALLRAVLEVTDDEGREIWLQVHPDNRAAVALYRRHGFVETAQRGDLAGEGHIVLRRAVGG